MDDAGTVALVFAIHGIGIESGPGITVRIAPAVYPGLHGVSLIIVHGHDIATKAYKQPTCVRRESERGLVELPMLTSIHIHQHCSSA